MIFLIFTITISYFFIGYIVTAIVNKNAAPPIKRSRWRKYYVYFIIVHLLLVIIYWGSFLFYPIVLLIVFIGAYEIFINYRRKIGKSVRFLMATTLTYFLISAGFIRFALLDRDQILFVYFLVVVFDGFSQITGQLFGKTRLTLISPNKTVEGVLGGMVFTIISSLLFTQWLAISGIKIVFLAFLMGAACLLGDLLASWYKRKVDSKDYSNLIPGHGGVLDRFDSFLFAGSVWYVLFLLRFI